MNQLKNYKIKKYSVFFASLAIFCLTSCGKNVSCICTRYDFVFGGESKKTFRNTPYETCDEFQNDLNKDYDMNSRYGMYNCMEVDD